MELDVGKAEEGEVGDDAQEQDEARNRKVDQRAHFQICKKRRHKQMLFKIVKFQRSLILQ